jgi:hypothetical protein
MLGAMSFCFTRDTIGCDSNSFGFQEAVMKLFKKHSTTYKERIYFNDGVASHKNYKILHITPT